MEPPDPIPNSEVKRGIADGSVGHPHVRVGHRQAFIQRNPSRVAAGVFRFLRPGLSTGRGLFRRKLIRTR